jgi:hypothetical protein
MYKSTVQSLSVIFWPWSGGSWYTVHVAGGAAPCLSLQVGGATPGAGASPVKAPESRVSPASISSRSIIPPHLTQVPTCMEHS